MTTDSPVPSPTPQAPSPAAPGKPEHHFQHDPDQTALERLLNSWLEKIEPYSNQILLGFIAFTVLAVGSVLWLRSSQASSTAGWQELIAAREADDFGKVAQSHPGTALGSWARLQQGRRLLRDGLRTVMRNRAASDESLEEARKAFDELLKNPRGVPAPVREEALYSMGMALEALSDGQNEAAIKAYEELITAFPASKHRRWAEERIERLSSSSAREFYTWFRQQQISPADRPLPRDTGTTGESGVTFPDFPLGSPAVSPATEVIADPSGDATSPASNPFAPVETVPASEASEAPVEPSNRSEPAEQAPASEPATSSGTAPQASETETSEPPPPSSEPAPSAPATESTTNP